ncbi:MAG: hypothetical protein SVS85_00340 [Candidatus Nanohaloarchaea archaeon]|nr:hypothetical protein [Candidatus Nanohaloarchaea archaeon]
MRTNTDTGEKELRNEESDGNTLDEDRNYDDLAREVNHKKTRRVLHHLQNEDYIGSVKDMVGLSFQGTRYHVEKLQDRGLVAESGQAEGRTYYKITPEGKEVLERLPEVGNL